MILMNHVLNLNKSFNFKYNINHQYIRFFLQKQNKYVIQSIIVPTYKILMNLKNKFFLINPQCGMRVHQ